MTVLAKRCSLEMPRAFAGRMNTPAQEFRRARNESSMRRFRRADVAPRSKKLDRAVVFGDHLEDVQITGFHGTASQMCGINTPYGAKLCHAN